MRKSLLWSMTLCALVLLVSTAFGDIRLNVENPTNGQDISGIVTISGWTFSTTPNTNVSVTLTVDGTATVAIPCCGPRADVQAANPGAPLNSSFSLLFNYGNLPAGPHTFTIAASAQGETAQNAQVMVNVAKPADAQFLSAFTIPASATIAADANEIVI